MALNKTQLKELMLATARASKNAPTAYSFGEKTYSYEDLNETLRNELNDMASTFAKYRRNQLEIFELIEETIDEILPKRVLENYGMFAEVKVFGQGDRPVFVNRREGRKRAKQFVTRVGLAGIYEVFKLDRSGYEVNTSAYGGAAQIGFEEFLDGLVDFAEVTQIIMEGLDEIVYVEIAKALAAGIGQLPEANKTAVSGFEEAELDQLIAVARAYGDPTIYCTYELASKILPADKWISEATKNEYNSKGYLGSFKGARIIVMPQSFEDETNSVKVIDPSYAWIIPTGGNDKPVKIAFEGQTIVKEYENRDLSREIQVYKKMGVLAIMTNNICVYEDLSL